MNLSQVLIHDYEKNVDIFSDMPTFSTSSFLSPFSLVDWKTPLHSFSPSYFDGAFLKTHFVGGIRMSFVCVCSPPCFSSLLGCRRNVKN